MCIREETHTEPCAVALPCERHHGYAHRERLTGRNPARIGKRIERDIHIPVLRQIVTAEPAHLDTRSGNPTARETLRDHRAPLLMVKDLALDEETRPRHRIQHLPPEAQHLIRHLIEIIE